MNFELNGFDCRFWDEFGKVFDLFFGFVWVGDLDFFRGL